MGRASSSKKVSRAAKAAGRPGTSSSLVWPGVIGLIVLLGVGLVAVSAIGRSDDASAAPLIGDHWHAAYGVYVCDAYQPTLADAQADESGIHTHADGLIHIHPFSTRYTGEDANLAAFGETVHLELSDDSLTLPDGTTYENGDDCGGEPGVVQVKVWENLADADGRLLESGFADYAPQEGQLVTIAFAPEGTQLDLPPSAGTQPTDVVPAPGATLPQGVPSTLPAEGSTGGEAPAEGEAPADPPATTEGEADPATDTTAPAAEGGATTDTSAG
jgi:hypothetical protein